MKTKFLFFFLLLVGVGKTFAQGNEELILKALEKRVISSVNLDSIPGTSSEKALAILMEGEWLLVSTENKKEGIFLDLWGNWTTAISVISDFIRYNPEKAAFEHKRETTQKQRKHDPTIAIMGMITVIISLISYITGYRDIIKQRKDPFSVFYYLFIIGGLALGITITANLYCGLAEATIIAGFIFFMRRSGIKKK